LINRTTGPLTATLNITNSQTLSLADAFELTGSSAAISHVVYNSSSPQWQWLGANSLSYNMPAMSVTTLALVRAQLGDLNLDGLMTNADIQAMLDAVADPTAYETAHNLTAANLVTLGDFNHDGDFSSADISPMLDFLARGGGLQGVPEPASVILIALGATISSRSIVRRGKRMSDRGQFNQDCHPRAVFCAVSAATAKHS
jgi:hypothetical protein